MLFGCGYVNMHIYICTDGGLAVNATLNNPQGFYVASSGEIYISDTGNNRIRKILTNGTILTIAGTGLYFHIRN